MIGKSFCKQSLYLYGPLFSFDLLGSFTKSVFKMFAIKVKPVVNLVEILGINILRNT